jgi:MFS family permease
VLQAGLVLNAFGNGAANPFVVLYLHEVRGIPLGVAGLAGSLGAVAALVSALVSGHLGDRVGARATMIGGLLVSSAAFGLYPFVSEPWEALAVSVLAGTGIGAWLTMQSSLVAALTPTELRHIAFARQRVAANLGLGLGGFVGGMVAASSFTVLFALNVVTFLVYAVFVARLPEVRAECRVVEGGYREVLRDHTFLRLMIFNLVVVAGTVSLVNGLFPVFATSEAGLGEREIGVLFLVNSLLIVVVQLPVARASEGHRRMRGLSLMALLFALTWTLVLAGGTTTGLVAFVVLGVAVAVLSIGECLYDTVVGPLVADLAPEQLTGRYMAVTGFSWQLGFIVGPGIGGFVLGAQPFALPALAAVVALLAGLYALRVERALPVGVRLTPVPA